MVPKMEEEIDMKDFGKKVADNIKEQYKDMQQRRFKIYGSRYRLDRWIFISSMILIFGYLLFVAWSYNFELDYYVCGAEPGKLCRNPFYRAQTWKNIQYLKPGYYGAKLGALFNSVYYVPVMVLLLAIGINHFIHNKKKRAPCTPPKEKSPSERIHQYIEDEEEP